MDPYLSIVLCGRNDNYGGDFVQRLQSFLDWNISYLEKYKIKSEIIFVNWNPVNENLPIDQLIKLPINRQYVIFSIITVPNEIHESYSKTGQKEIIPIYEFVAKNAGIKRAKGTFILSVNADILIHEQIFHHISKYRLSESNYYRANRIDFKKVNTKLTRRSIWKTAFVVSLKGFTYYFSPYLPKKIQYGFCLIFNQMRIKWEFWKLKNQKICNKFKINVVYDNAVFHVHSSASGDFMMMHRNNWQKLNAYPEYTSISTHTDFLFTLLSHAFFKEKTFFYPIFHQDHERRYELNKMNSEKYSIETMEICQDLNRKILNKENITPYLNGEDWGLMNIKLKSAQR